MTRWMPHALSALAVFAFGCGDPSFDHMEYSQVSESPGTVDLLPRGIRIEKGIAVRAHVAAIGDDDEPMEALNLETGNSRVFQVDLGPNPDDYVFSGVDVGTAELNVESGHRLVATLRVDVLAPSE